MNIIGFTGYKGSGKSEAARALYSESLQVNFADSLKEMFDKIATHYSLYGPTEVRNKAFITGTTVTVRRALQTVGVAMRDLDEDFWVKLWKDRIKRIKETYTLNPKVYKYWTVGDVRFPNEVKAINELGGCIIRIVRPSITNHDNHSSETSIESLNVDHIIVNDGSIDHLHKQIRKFVENR